MNYNCDYGLMRDRKQALDEVYELRKKLNNIQKFLEWECEHCIDNIQDDVPGCKKASNIYKLGVYNTFRLLKTKIEGIINGIEVDFNE